jgi:hypothetical protein
MESEIHKICYPLHTIRPTLPAPRSTGVERTLQIHLFLQNKANFRIPEIGASSYETGKYELLSAWRGGKTNPIQTQFKPGISTKNPARKPRSLRHYSLDYFDRLVVECL